MNTFRTVCKGNFAAAARLHGVPVTTIKTWVAYPNMTVVGSGCKTQLEPYIEQTLSDVIDLLSKSGLPLDRSDVQDLAADIVSVLGLTTNFTNGRPGIDWIRAFEKRWNHCFSRRAREGISYQRAQGLAKHNVELFFDKLQSLEDTYHFKPQNVWN